jgi:hypothetical protein
MRVLSVNVGLPREVEWRDEVVATAIHKSDLSVHGGPDKA